MSDMTDREMLELAAKAAGIQLRPALGGAVFIRDIGDDAWQVWNPLTDDGDAFRLMVKVGFLVDTHGLSTKAGLPYQNWPVVKHGTDPYAATRRAITRAAAEIGRAMK